MAFDYLLDKNTGDISIIKGVIQFTRSKQDSSRQQVFISLSTYRGEWGFNIEAGIPYIKNDNNFISILGKVDKSLLDSYVTQDILLRESIVALNSYSSILDKNTRQITISFEAETDSGEIIQLNDQVLSIEAL
jgi:hypothetical protein